MDNHDELVNNVLTFFFLKSCQAFLEVWKIACSLSGFIVVVFPYGKTFLVHPIDIGGPYRSKITLRVSTKSV